MANIVSMKRTPEDKRQDAGEAAPMEAVGPDYPYGLCLNMDGDELDKLGMTTLPKVGATYTMSAKVTVTAVRQEAGSDSEEYRNVAFQITDLGLEPAGK